MKVGEVVAVGCSDRSDERPARELVADDNIDAVEVGVERLDLTVGETVCDAYHLPPPAANVVGERDATGGDAEHGIAEIGVAAADAVRDDYDRLEVTVQRPDGSGLTAAHGAVEVEDAGTGRIHIDNASGGPDPGNQDHQVWIQVSDCGTSGPPAAGSWTVRVRATAAASGEPYHLWITDTGLTAHGAAGSCLSNSVSS